MRFSFVCDFGLEAVVVVGYVLDVLNAAVGKSHRVGAMHVLTVRFLRVAEIGARVVVLDSVVEGVRLGFLKYNVENNPIINAFWEIVFIFSLIFFPNHIYNLNT